MNQFAARPPLTGGLASLEHWAYTQIKEAIVTLVLPPGGTLVEAQLADQLGISKTPLRAALLRLEREGFVESIPYKGSYVAPVTYEVVRQLYQIREAVEGYAVRMAATAFTKDDLVAIESLLIAQAKAVDAGNVEEAFTLDSRFHAYFVQRLENPRFTAIAEEVADHRRRVRHAMAGFKSDCGWVRECHAAVLAAVRAGDGNRAAELACGGIRTYLEWVQEAEQLGILGNAALAERSTRGADGALMQRNAPSGDGYARQRVG